jgi:tetratricopeptide (TPR) repeat protein
LLNIERGWYYQKRREALDLLADQLLEWEQQLSLAQPAHQAEISSPRTDTMPPPDVASPPDIGGFIGRIKELRYYQEKLAELNYVLIVGFPGAGKTSLAAKLVRATVAPDKIFWYKCHEGDGADSLIWALAGFLANRGQTELWQILNVAISNEREAMPLSMRITYAIKLLAQDDYLICLDDFQHVDTDKDIVQLASRFYEIMQKNQLKLVITSHRTPSFIRQHFEPLTGLTPDDASQLVAARGLTLAPQQLTKLYANTEGHALFLNLGIDALKETAMPDRLLSTLPETEQIERFLLQTVDQQLSEEERMVMEAISILGDYSGGRDLIETILNAGGIRRPLQTLSERHLLTLSLSEGGRVYSQHAIIRAYYYDTLGPSQRRAMHSRAAAYYETLDPHTLEAILHNTQAGQYRRAAELVATHTRALINQGHARTLYQVLTEISVKGLPVELCARFNLAQGQICALLGEGQAARQYYQAAIADLHELPPSPTIQELRARICRGMGELLQHEEPSEALAWLNRGLAELADASTTEEAALRIKIGSVQIALGDYDAAFAAVETGQALLPATPDQLHISALVNLGTIYSARGDLPRGTQYTRQGLELSRQLNFQFMTLGPLHNLAIDLHIAGEWTSAQTYYEEALALAEQLGDVHEQVVIRNSRGMLYTMQGDEVSAHSHLIGALELTRQHRLQEAMAYVLQSLADLQLRQKAWAQAQSSLTEAQELAQTLGIRSLLPEINLGWAQLWLALEQPATARHHAEQALSLAQALQLERETGMAHHILAQIFWAEQRPEEALLALAQSVAILDPLDPYQAALSKWTWSGYLAALERPNEAKTLHEEAQHIFSTLGVSHESPN